MAGSRTVLLFALLAMALVILVVWVFQPSDDGPSSDAELVYCLAPAHQAGLVSAAVSLGVVSAGSSTAAVRVSGGAIPLSTWSARDKAGFQRACDAYAAPAFASSSSSAAGSGIDGILNVLLPVAVGALLTLATTEVQRGSERRWEEAEALRDSWSAFRGVIETYVKGRQEPPAEGMPAKAEIDGLRRDLEAKLRRIHSQYQGSPTIISLRKQLTAELGAAIALGWAGGDTEQRIQQRRERADEVTRALDDYDAAVQAVARKLGRGIWLPWKL